MNITIAFTIRKLSYALKELRNLSFFFSLPFILMSVMLSGCVTTYKTEPDLIQSFKEPIVPANKTGIYVIRGSNFLGLARGIWVAINDKVVADLPNSSHVYLELDSGINTLHFVQAIAGYGYLAVDNKPGEILYARFGYGIDNVTEFLPKDLGKSMVMQTAKVEPLMEKKENTAYVNLLLNPGILKLPIMIDSPQEPTPDASHAVVRFYRSGRLIPSVAFDIWNQDGYIGSTKGETYFSAKLKPGHHVFVAKSERYSVLDAELVANKEYAVELDVGIGWQQAHIKLLPIDLNTDAGITKIKYWKVEMKSKIIDPKTSESGALAPRIKAGLAYLAKERSPATVADEPKRFLPAEFGR